MLSRSYNVINRGFVFWLLYGLFILSVIFSLGLSYAFAAQSDNWDVEGEHGELYVTGVLFDSACWLDMDSAYQEVSLGQIGQSSLLHVGDRSDAENFLIKLHGCFRRIGEGTDNVKLIHVLDPIQPSIRVNFFGVADKNSPQLLKVSGITGVGIRITNEHDRDVRLGQSGEPHLLDNGDNQMLYKVALERTRAPLSAGYYRSEINFTIDYN